MKYLTVYFEGAPELPLDGRGYGFIDVDCDSFTRPDGRHDIMIVNGAVIRVPGPIVDVRARFKLKEKTDDGL